MTSYPGEDGAAAHIRCWHGGNITVHQSSIPSTFQSLEEWISPALLLFIDNSKINQQQLMAATVADCGEILSLNWATLTTFVLSVQELFQVFYKKVAKVFLKTS